MTHRNLTPWCSDDTPFFTVYVCVCVCVWGGEKGEVRKEKGEKETV